jgi:hypothetical protein
MQMHRICRCRGYPVASDPRCTANYIPQLILKHFRDIDADDGRAAGNRGCDEMEYVRAVPDIRAGGGKRIRVFARVVGHRRLFHATDKSIASGVTYYYVVSPRRRLLPPGFKSVLHRRS